MGAAGGVFALGNFDGFHKGHQQVVARATGLAGTRGLPAGVITFNPHPSRFFRPGQPPFLLTMPAQKAALLAAAGVEQVVTLPFDAALASLSAATFIERHLLPHVGTGGVVCGYDFTFGKDRTGNAGTLQAAGSQHGFTVDVVAPVTSGTDAVTSSSRIRAHLREGEPVDAAQLLGRWWRLAGPVTHGDKRGRTIGVPTANVPLGDYLRPRFGVYAVRCTLPGRKGLVDGIANIGSRPTVDGTDERLEVFLFDFEGDLYDQEIGIDIIEFIRPERRFDGLMALKEQISCDCHTARKLLRQPAYAPGRWVSTARTG